MDTPETYEVDKLSIRRFGAAAEERTRGFDAVVLLHGWGRSRADLEPLGELIAAHYPVLLVDLPGFGASPPPPESGWDTGEYARLLLRLLDSSALKRVVLIGHSFGGRISLRISAEHPERVAALVLIDAHGLKPIRSLKRRVRLFLIRRLGKAAKFLDRMQGRAAYTEKFRKRFGSPDYQRAGVLRATLVKTVNEDQTKNAEAIAAPTLLLWGELDQETPIVLAERLQRLIKDSRLVVLQGKGHDPFAGAGSHLCAYHILPFLHDRSAS